MIYETEFGTMTDAEYAIPYDQGHAAAYEAAWEGRVELPANPYPPATPAFAAWETGAEWGRTDARADARRERQRERGERDECASYAECAYGEC
jgi:hypothetical protein